MPDLLNVTYAQTGKSSSHNALGMREMQARAYEKRNAQFLLLKAPPASGKSRALMFLALDKIQHQGLEKVIIAVPEMSIGGSFKDTDLMKYGFFANWHIDPKYNLCTPGSEGKVDTVLKFLDDDKDHYLLCTHATLRFAYDRLGDVSRLNKTLLAIDEFHHTSAEDGNKLGAMLDDVIAHSSAHIVAMTGSYFRGDQVPILSPETEAKFTQVTYTYYEQLNGYKYLKSLGLGYHFYLGRYFDALKEVLDVTKKTIVHIPNVNSRASTGNKLNEVDQIIDVIGTVVSKDSQTGIMTVKAKKTGKLLKVADLVSDDPMRVNVLGYLRQIKERDEMDIIIALGMAKEGFDWPWCEHVLTIGYRASLTEVVQIIGRATRDCEGKTHAQFTNLIAQPDAEDEDVNNAVNNLMKAIALSLLMREVLAPNITFRPRSTIAPEDKVTPGEIIIDDTTSPVTPKVKEILENGGITQVLTNLFNTPEAIAPAIVNNDTKLTTEVALPKVIMQTFPGLTPEEAEVVHQAAKTQLVVQGQGGLLPKEQVVRGQEGPTLVVSPKTPKKPDGNDKGSDDNDIGSNDFVKIADKFLNVDDLNIDLIDSINPFQGAYEILSKSFDAPMLKTIQDRVASTKSEVSEEEAVLLWPEVKKFTRDSGRKPSISSNDAYERRLAEVLAFMRDLKAKRMQEGQG